MANILVVDDVEEVRFIVREVLERNGHRVAEACDGAEALRLLGLSGEPAKLKPDLIVLDIMMPNVDGLTVNNRLTQDDDLRHIPVIILTARGEMLAPFRQAANVVRVVEKPIRPKQLSELIEGELKKLGGGAPPTA